MKSEEIAKLAGVSRSTVSRVINNYSNVPEKTKKRVMEIIDKYNYQPNTSARVLAGKGTNTIGLFIISIADKQNTNRIYQNNYFSPFIDAVIDIANAQNYYVLVNTIYTEQDYVKVKEAFMQKRIDGGIIVGTEKNLDIIQDVVALGYPLSIIDYDSDEFVDLSHNHALSIINSLDYDGSVQAMEYLIGLGHKKIGIIAGRMNTFSGKQRFKAYTDTLASNALAYNKYHILYGEFLKETTTIETKKLINSGNFPTAIFSCSDEMALVAINIFKEYGIDIPKDISIIGFDDIPLSSQLSPALTTIRIPIYNMAKSAVENLIMMLEKGNQTIKTINFSTELIIRESCI